MYHSINMEIRSIWPIILNEPHWPWVTSAIFDKDAKLVAPMVKNPPAMQEIQVRSLGWKIPWRKERLPTPVFLPGNIYGQRSLAGYSSWGCKELDTTEWLTLFILFFQNLADYRSTADIPICDFQNPFSAKSEQCFPISSFFPPLSAFWFLSI